MKYLVVVKNAWASFELSETDELSAKITTKLWNNKKHFSAELYKVSVDNERELVTC